MRVASTVVELLHAILLVMWIGGLPLLFWHRHPRLSRAYALYAIVFVVLSQLSHHLTGECVITSLARVLWESGDAAVAPAELHEWFTVRLAKRIFGLAPSHRTIVVAWEAAIAVTALGALLTLRVERSRRRHA